jgi:adenosylcobinamide-GDP ribazoletransferase
MLPWFPVVGLFLGAFWAGFDAAVEKVFPPALRGAFDVLILAVITGGLHLDGLADTADGLLSQTSREEALHVMRDSRIGTWGALALIGVIGFKLLALSQPFHGARFMVMLLIPAYGRTAMLIGIWMLPYGRREEGIAMDLFTNVRRFTWIPGILLVVLGSTFLGWPGALVMNIVFMVVVALILVLYWYRFACITGDMLGAMGEVTEATLLVAMATA